MNRNLTLAAMGLFVMAAVGPVTAYHIEGTPVDPAGIGIGAADWQILVPGLIICESDGDRDADLNEVDSDDRLGFGTDGEPGAPGAGGLCTTGESFATGTEPVTDADYNDLLMNKQDYIRIDACSVLTSQRAPFTGVNNSLWPWVADEVGPCAPAGRTDQHGWSARVGAFECFVPTNTEPAPIATADFALYYNRLYAYWSYDGDGWYTDDGETGNVSLTSPGAMATGSDGAAPNDNDGDPQGNDYTDNERANHGHAAMFIALDRSATGATTQGSAETTGPTVDTAWDFGGRLSDMPEFGLGGGGTYGNNCGGSPACPPTSPAMYAPPANDPAFETCDTSTVGIYGPVIRAPYDPVPDPTVCEEGLAVSNDWLVGGSASVHDVLGLPDVDEGVMVLTRDLDLLDALPDIGGTTAPPDACAIEVDVDQLGDANVTFAACKDMDLNGVCIDEFGPAATNGICGDIIAYNHAGSVPEVLPELTVELPTIDASLVNCPGAVTDWLVFICEVSVHANPVAAIHPDPVTGELPPVTGTVTTVAAGAPMFDGSEDPSCGVGGNLLFTGKVYIRV